MGHKFGYIACKKSVSGLEIDLERQEYTPLLPKYDKPTIRQCDSSFIFLSCILIIGSLIGLYLLCNQERSLKFNVPFFMIERAVLNLDGFGTSTLLLKTVASTTPSIVMNNGVIFMNTRFPQCFTKQMCMEIIKSLMSLGVPVQQNFLIGGDGHVYEVLGWDYPSKFEELSQKDMITVGFMGDFTYHSPPKLMFDVAKALISESIRRRRLNSNYNVFGMRNNSGSDGNALYQQLSDWPHWKSVIDLKP